MRFEDFYNNLKSLFPDIRELQVWTEWDWSNDSCEQCVVISEVAREMIKWASKNEFEKVDRLLIEIEKAISEADDSVKSYIGTDFLVTILEVKNKEIRKKIKSLMKEQTSAAYQIILRGYGEPN